MEHQDPNREFFFKNLFPIVKEHAEMYDWPEITEADVEPVYMKALSNMTYKVKCKIPGTQPILAKYFGQGFLDSLLDRNIDNDVSSTFGELDIGPKVYYCSDKCRIEQFVFSTEFTNEDMQDDSKRKLLSYYMTNLHKSSIPSIPKGSLLSRCQTATFPLIDLARQSAEQKKDLFDDKEKQIVEDVLSLAGQDELAFLNNITSEFENDLVVSHNDFLNGNILNLPTGELKLIDFEYTSYNIKMFDIANFINESLFNYALDKFPYFEYNGNMRDDDSRVREMIKYYALFFKESENIDFERANELIDNEKTADAELVRLYGSMDAAEAEIDNLMKQLHASYLLSHAFWILWAIVMCKNSSIQFGYIEFARQRYEDYLMLKSKYYDENN